MDPPKPGEAGTPRYVRRNVRLDEASCALVWCPGSPAEQRYVFTDEVEIGRYENGREPAPGQLLIPDPTISRRHCVMRQESDGRCFARDVSRNGTRIDGRRIVPNLDVEIRHGQVLTVAHTNLVFEASGVTRTPDSDRGGSTVSASTSLSIATVLVGDIRDYTGLVRRASPVELQLSVHRLFEILNGAVTEYGGTVKEYQGDAVLAFWEGGVAGSHASEACRAALALDRLARRAATDPDVWRLRDHPLRVDWALATGPVLLGAFGGLKPTGLSLIGAPVVLAFRLEKFATDATGRILACPLTKDLAGEGFAFRDLGLMHAPGFDQPDHVFALDGER